jgi:hypothetical protein
MLFLSVANNVNEWQLTSEVFRKRVAAYANGVGSPWRFFNKG